MRKYIFLFSLKAGSKNFKKLENNIIHSFKKHNKLNQLKIIKTKDENSIREISHEIGRQDEKNLLIICGGDGSLHEALPGVINTKTILSAYPMGTGNDFLRNFNPIKSIDDFFDLNIRKIDTLSVNDFYALNSVSVGLDVEVVRGANSLKDKYSWLDNGAYYISAVKNLINYKNYPLNIHLENENEIFDSTGKFTLIALSSGQYYGGGFRTAPLSKVDDGLLDVTIADSLSRRQLIPLLLKYRTGDHLGEKGVSYKKIKKATIKSLDHSKLVLNADGEIYEEDVWNIEILPKSLYWATVR